MSFAQYKSSKVKAVDRNNDSKIDGYYAPFDAKIWKGVIEFKEEYIALKDSTQVKKSDVRVILSEDIFGTISSSRDTKFSQVDDDFELRLYSRSAWKAIYGEINSKTFRAIANDAQLKSKASVASLVVPEKGEFLFRDVKQDDCIIIGNAGRNMEYKYLWAPIKADDIRWGKKEISVKLQLLTDVKGMQIFE